MTLAQPTHPLPFMHRSPCLALVILVGVALLSLTPRATFGAVTPRMGPAADAPSQAELKIGDAAPDFNLPGIDSKHHTLATYASAKLLMIAFLSNHCPDSNATTPRIITFAKEYARKGVQVV